MIDRTISFYNTILRCDRYTPQEIILPDGFEIISYRIGDEKAWAKLEYDIGDFGSIEESEQYFISTYMKDVSQLGNILFLLNSEKQVIGSCIAWQDARGNSSVASLHWLVVEEDFQGQGLGRALCTAVMNRFAKQGRLPVYIHTQPWSWKAILLYISIGFKIQKTDTFSRYENQFALAIETLQGIVPKKQFDYIIASSEPLDRGFGIETVVYPQVIRGLLQEQPSLPLGESGTLPSGKCEGRVLQYFREEHAPCL